MKDINEMIKEYDTDNSIVKEIDSIVYDMVDDMYNYESGYGSSETILESLKKFKKAMYYKLLKEIRDAKSMFRNTDLQLTVEKSYDSSSGVINVYGKRSKGSWIDKQKYQSLSITDMKFDLVGILSTDIDAQGIFVGTLKMSDTIGAPVKISGVLCGVCDINNKSQMCMLKVVEATSGGNNEVYLLLNDTSVLTTTGQDLHITTATGTLNHTYDN